MLHRDQSKKGKWIKIGEWLKMDDILGAKVSQVGGKNLIIRQKGKPPYIYRGPHVDHVKEALVKAGKGE